MIRPIHDIHQLPHRMSFIINPYRYGSAAPTYLLQENCDGTGTPSGWTDVNTPDWDYTTSPAPLEGTQSLFLAVTGNKQTYKDFTSNADVWLYLMFNITSFSSGSSFIRLRNSTTDVALFRAHSSTAFRLTHGTVNSSVGGSYSVGTTYHLWLHYVKSTASNGVLDAFVSTTATKPGAATLSISNGDATANADRLFLISGAAADHVIDKIRVDDVEIGSSPT